jgi:uncharacterized protein YndB with AHSA1/START domain
MPSSVLDVTLGSARVTVNHRQRQEEQPMPDFTESITIDAPPDRLYALVSDLPRMGEWSPECTRVTWTAGTTSAVAGARFIGHNRAGAIRWFTQGEVLEASPGRRFSFRIHFGPVPIALWTYEFTPTSTGCALSESWTDHRPAVLRPAFRWLFGNRRHHNQSGIHKTLQALKSTAESTT